MDCKIRVLKISVKNLKNLKDGSIEFESYKNVLSGNFNFEKSDIVGIYGQNGSSKSTIINAFSVLKTIFTSQSINNDFYEKISKNANACKIEISLYNEYNDCNFIYDYYLNLTKDEASGKITLSSEGLYGRKYIDNEWTKNKPIFEINKRKDDLMKFISPATNLDKLSKEIEKLMPQLIYLKGQKEANNCSFIFSREFEKILLESKEFIDVGAFINMARIYSMHYCHLYDNREISKIAALDTIPFFYKNESDEESDSAQAALSLFTEGKILKKYEKTINLYVDEINLVLEKLVPGTKIALMNLGDTVNEKNEACFKYQFVSLKKEFKIPLSLESDGVKKIISIVSSLVDAFNNPFAILIIDEFDSGIFEFLLGSILSVFKNKGKGQLLFTSHNLRALEVIKDNIVFTTNDDENRFVKMPYIAKTNNLRKKYLRDLYLGELNLSNPIDEYEIYRALKDAGELYLYGKEE